METMWNKVEEATKIAILGHIRPDGDCIGSCMGLYLYLKKKYPNKQIAVYFENMPERFQYLFEGTGYQEGFPENKKYDLVFALDASDKERLGEGVKLAEKADAVICVDHHISNTKYGDINIVEPEASSASEVLFELLDETYIDQEIATAIYLGMAHDSGVFKYPSTSRKTMEIAGKLIEKGVRITPLIDRTIYQKTYVQNQILGRVLLESILLLDGKVIASCVTEKNMSFYGANKDDLEGIIEQLRITKGVEVAIFLQEVEPLCYKVSLRSNEMVDVRDVAMHFGGGGHIKAAGCTMSGTYHDILNSLLELIDVQMKN